jgi:hypothetical protein
MEAGDSEEEAVQVFDRPWSIRRVDFSSLKLYMYAHIWIGAIIADFCRESTSDEADFQPTEKCIHGAACRSHRDEHGILECIFSFQGPKPSNFVRGKQFILSRVAPDVDGLYKYLMRIETVTESTLLVVAPRRVPADVDEGCWRMDF